MHCSEAHRPQHSEDDDYCNDKYSKAKERKGKERSTGSQQSLQEDKTPDVCAGTGTALL